MAKRRNYKKEYQRRTRGVPKGQRAQARGHKSKAVPSAARGEALDKAVRAMVERGVSLTDAARSVRLAPETLRRYLRDNTDAQFKGRRWRIRDKGALRVLIAEDGVLATAVVSKRTASKIGSYWNGVQKFRRSNRKADLAAIQGWSILDIKKKRHWLEDRPHVLRRLSSSGQLSFLTIYADTQPEPTP